MITYNGYWFLWNIIGASQGNNSHKILDYSNKEFWGYYGSGNRSYTIAAAADGILCGYLSVYVAQVNIYINANIHSL